MNELIFSDARLRFISSLDKKSRIVLMAYENYCNQLDKMSKLQELNQYSLSKSLNLSLETTLLFLEENGINVNWKTNKYSTISENTNMFTNTSSLSCGSDSTDNSESSDSSEISYSSEDEKPDIEEVNHVDKISS